jgi:hypothetical protein
LDDYLLPPLGAEGWLPPLRGAGDEGDAGWLLPPEGLE